MNKRIHLRMLILLAAIIVCALVSSAHIRAVGRIYDLRIEGFDGYTISAENLSIDPPGMARVNGVRQDADGVFVATIEGLAPGEGYLMVSLPDTGGSMMLSVQDGPVVVANGADFSGWEYVVASVALCFALAAAICIWNLVSLRRRAWYGYAMAAYAGGALFCAIEAVTFGLIMAPGTARSFSDFAEALLASADSFIDLMIGPMVVIAILVCVSNIALVRHEGRHPANLLGIAASLAFAIALLIMRFLSEQIVQSTLFDAMVALYAIRSVFSIGVVYLLALFLGVCTCAYGAAKHVPAHPRDFLIILGCGLRADGTPTPLLAARVDAALGYAQAQVEAGYQAPAFVPSGGQGADEVIAESRSMERYLKEKGVDAERIFCEDTSTSTRENFSLSAKVIEENKAAPKPRIAFATTNYHVFRSYIFAHEAGLEAEGIAAPTKLYFWPNAFLREFVGLLAARALPIALGYLAVAAIYLVAEYVVVFS